MSTDNTVIRAEHNSKFYLRFLLMGIGVLIYACFFIKDGAYSWPQQHERYVAYTTLVDEFRGGEWEEYAKERGWPTEPPEKDRTEVEIQNQFYWAAGLGVVGVLLLLKVFLARGNWIEADGNQITTSWGQTVPYHTVTEIDKKKWANKGLAYISYQDGEQSKTLTIDDFKFKREPTDAILYQMEQAVGVDKIVNGDPEPDPNEVANSDDVSTDDASTDDEAVVDVATTQPEK
ncbi:MAG: hypothetical protein AAGF31_10550 [Planctomycetota bacterium]